jgi:hypothetical protein
MGLAAAATSVAEFIYQPIDVSSLRIGRRKKKHFTRAVAEREEKKKSQKRRRCNKKKGTTMVAEDTHSQKWRKILCRRDAIRRRPISTTVANHHLFFSTGFSSAGHFYGPGPPP